MQRALLSYLSVIFLVTLSFFSCVPKKGVTNAKKDLTGINNQLQQQTVTLKDLEAQRKKKEQQNEIDDTANARIKKFIEKTNKEIDTLINKNTIVIGETVVEKADWDRLKRTLSFSRKASKNINDRILLLSDLINRNMVVRIDQDVVFEPGKYDISPAVASAIGRLFEPASKEIDLFIKKYPNFPLSLVITAKGYSDATSIAEGSQLYKELKDRLKLQTDNPTAKELNKELSVARAQAVIDLFKSYTVNRGSDGGNVRNILYLHEGKGETLPDPKVKDYRVEDARRRVVLLFWSVFPE